jgi:uncharacterized protein YprB with RNaseH-like and TPR domain
MKLGSNSLHSACSFLQIDGKGHVDGNLWRAAKYGDSKALVQVLQHNKDDVIVLEKLHNRLINFSKWTKKSI